MTIKQLEKLKADGFIRDYSGDFTPRPTKKQESPAKRWILETLQAWCAQRGLILIEELRFHKDRMWRFDYAVIIEHAGMKLAIEYEGIFSKKSRHTTRSGYTGDADKYNAAAADGWKVLRYTAKNYRNLPDDLQKLEPIK